MADIKTVEPKEGALVRFWNWLTETQVWASIFRHGRPTTDRNRVLVMLSNVFLHLHPVRIRKSGVKLRYTWCMGGLSFFLFLVLTFTGLLLMFYYRPTLEYAYTDIVSLREHVPLGIMREMHRWGAHAMVITVWLHMFRVFMTGSYKPPREFNWSVGVVMLVLTLLLSFTGYLLPWDQLAIWAITVGSNMARATPFLGHEGPGASLLRLGDVPLIHAADDARFALLGGTFVGEGALLRFYVLHCVGLPLGIAVLMAVHFWRVRKDGGISGTALGIRNLEFGIKNYEFPEKHHQRRRRSAAVLPARVRRPRARRLEAREGRVERGRLRRPRRAGRLLHLRHVRSELPAHRHQARQRADRRPDLPARVLHLVLDSRRRPERSPDRGGARADREGGVGSRVGVARPGLHRAHRADSLLGRPDRLVDLPEGAARAAGEPGEHAEPVEGAVVFPRPAGNAGTSIRGSPASCCPA